MLAVLLESRAARPHHIGSTLFSACIHGALIAAVVAFTLRDRESASPAADVHPATLTFVSPASPPASPSTRSPAPRHAEPSGPTFPIIELPVITPTGIPPIDLTIPGPASTDIRLGERSDVSSSALGSPGIPLSDTSDVNDVSMVDRTPALIGRALEPRYPPTLRSAGVQGRVLAEFVVDSAGRAELATLRFSALPDPLFGDAVREVLPGYRFRPGEVAGRKVRTRVEMPFDFRLVK